MMLSLLVLLHLRVVAAQVVDCEAEASCAGMAPCCMVRLGPEDQTPEAYAAWRPGFEAWRTRVRAALESSAPRGFAAYDAPAVEWSRSDWVQAKTMLHDRYLFDRGTNQWTVQRYLDDLVDRYGGVDSVVPTPVITSSASLTHKRPLSLYLARALAHSSRSLWAHARARECVKCVGTEPGTVAVLPERRRRRSQSVRHDCLFARWNERGAPAGQ